MGKGFKLPGKLPGPPVKIAMPAVQGGGSYRRPTMIIDRSAEILGAGIQSGMDKIGDALKQKAMDKIAEEKGKEPQSNLDKELQKTELDLNNNEAENRFDKFMSGGYQAGDSLSSVVIPKTSFGFPMIDDELAAVGTPVDLPETPLQMKEESPLGFVPGQQMGQPQAFSYDVPQQANMMGAAQPVFSPQAMGMAQTAFGTPTMRQASVGAPFQVSEAQMEKFGPGGSHENPGLLKAIKNAEKK